MSDKLPSQLDVLEFWWEAGASKWFAGGDKFDTQCRQGFLGAIEAAKAGDLDHWTETADGTLALLLLLDQMTRNVFRGTADAFSGDQKAVAIAEMALQRGFDRAYPKDARFFFYLPFEHSENMVHQEKCVDLCRIMDHKEYYHYALIHMDVIRRFGRFPHRNEALGRTTTPEERAYLDSRGFSA